MIKLIKDYIAITKEAIEQLRNELGYDELLGAWHRHHIPQRGVLSDGSTYGFHGIGCCVTRPGEIDIDFDFGGGDSGPTLTGGFDAWRLWRYSKQFSEKYPEWQELETIEENIEILLEQGVIRKSKYRGDYLLYLKE